MLSLSQLLFSKELSGGCEVIWSPGAASGPDRMSSPREWCNRCWWHSIYILPHLLAYLDYFLACFFSFLLGTCSTVSEIISISFFFKCIHYFNFWRGVGTILCSSRQQSQLLSKSKCISKPFAGVIDCFFFISSSYILHRHFLVFSCLFFCFFLAEVKCTSLILF